jgi:arabinogalactan oligomer / maltooligosaccharide transport system substrate-binding protein
MWKGANELMLNKYVKTVIFGAVTVLAVSCGGTTSSIISEKPSYTLKVWGPSQEQQFLTDVTQSFKQLYPNITINFEMAVVGEPDLKGILLLDVPGGADVFAFPDDQLEDLVTAGAISELTQFKDEVIARNQDWTIDVASTNDKLYAYPNTADNGIFMYYDSRFINASEMTTLDSILAKAESLNSQIIIDPMGGWAMSAWFATAGNISWNKTTRTQTIDWDNAAGLSSTVGMYNAYKSNRIQRDQGLIVTEFLENDVNVQDGIIAGISGTWNAVAIKSILGENYAAIKLPTFTNGNGQQQQMGSMIGSKLVGVNAYTTNPGLAHAFANYLTNYENQLTKAVTMGVGPSNLAAQMNEEVQLVPSLKAIFDQAPHGILQARSVSSYYWSPAGAFADAVITDARNHVQNFAAWQALPGNATKTEAQFMTEFQIPKLQTYLDAFVSGVLAVNDA